MDFQAAAQNMPVKEAKGVECLILSCACDVLAHGQICQKSFDIFRVEMIRGLAPHKGFELPDPIAVGALPNLRNCGRSSQLIDAESSASSY